MNDRNGFQPVVHVDSLDSAVQVGTVEAPESSETTATIDVDAGMYLIMDPGFVFCEPPLLLSVAEEVVATPTTTEPSTASACMIRHGPGWSAAYANGTASPPRPIRRM